MNQKEMIEEMAKDILRHNKKINSYCALHTCEECLHTFPFPDCETHNFATDAVILGYRKIPEGSVVLTETQYNMLLNNQSTVISIDEQLEKEFEYELKQARKETAKEIIEIIKEMDGADLNYIAQKYGVEE